MWLRLLLLMFHRAESDDHIDYSLAFEACRYSLVHSEIEPFPTSSRYWHGNNQTGSSIVDIIRILLAIILPPVGVFLQVGLGLQFWLNILLTLCGYVPGIIHAIWVIMRR